MSLSASLSNGLAIWSRFRLYEVHCLLSMKADSLTLADWMWLSPGLEVTEAQSVVWQPEEQDFLLRSQLADLHNERGRTVMGTFA